MARRCIGQDQLVIGSIDVRGGASLDQIAGLLDWAALDGLLAGISASPKGEPGWPPLALFQALLLALFQALLLAMWYDLSDVRLAEGLDDRASFRRFCGSCRATIWVRTRIASLRNAPEPRLGCLTRMLP